MSEFIIALDCYYRFKGQYHKALFGGKDYFVSKITSVSKLSHWPTYQVSSSPASLIALWFLFLNKPVSRVWLVCPELEVLSCDTSYFNLIFFISAQSFWQQFEICFLCTCVSWILYWKNCIYNKKLTKRQNCIPQLVFNKYSVLQLWLVSGLYHFFMPDIKNVYFTYFTAVSSCFFLSF